MVITFSIIELVSNNVFHVWIHVTVNTMEVCKQMSHFEYAVYMDQIRH